MKNALLVIANPGTRSFSHALADVVKEVLLEQGYTCHFHDLYAEKFNPVQPTGESDNTSSDDNLVEQHCKELAHAELVCVIHPNWWSQPPAIMKGWIDRVFRLGTAYGYPEGTGLEGVPQGLLKARHAMVFNTSNTPEIRENNVFGDPLDSLWKHSIFELCGVKSVHRRMVGPMASSTPLQREAWLAEVRKIVRACCTS